MSWLEKLLPPRIKAARASSTRKSVPEGVWSKCPSCESVLYSNDLQANLHVCPKCDHHLRIGSRARLNALLDEQGRYEVGQSVVPTDALKFKDSRKYPERLEEAINATEENDALVVMGGTMATLPVVVACFEFEFMGGSMGSVVARGDRAKGGICFRICIGWSTDARRLTLFNADGQDHGRVSKAE
jgi:acetyl-CoA carboxylase carboxyl transferase subunit beta